MAYRPSILTLGSLLGLGVVSLALAAHVDAAPMACREIVALSIAHTRISEAQPVAAQGDLPEYCRVSGQIDGTIHFSLRLPVQWNGKLLLQAFGGLDGVLGMPEDPPSQQHPVSIGLRRGYAEIATDTGHVSADGTVYDGSWAEQNPQARIDWAYRSTHVVTVAGKAIATQYYRRAPAHSYLLGCSGGGRHATMAATRYPDDFDGIVAGAPFLSPAKEVLAWVWNEQALAQHPLDPAKLRLISKAVLEACAARPENVRDGFVIDPSRCHFEPATLACKVGEPPTDCLSDQEILTLKRIYEGPQTSTGAPLFFGQEAGTEALLWPKAIVNSTNGGPGELLVRIPGQFLEYFVSSAALEPLSFDMDRDTRALEAAGTLYDVSPQLNRFAKAGGKLILYHGWADPRIPPRATIAFYEAAKRNAAASGIQLDDSLRLYMVPGMGHCFGGSGADKVDWLSYLEQWVEQGVAPGAISASRSSTVLPALELKLCPYGAASDAGTCTGG
jgi:feruloyl esterase